MLLNFPKNTATPTPYDSGMASASDSIREVLAQNTRTLMKRRGWGQEKLGAKAGISQTHVGNVLRQTVEPTTVIISGLAQAFELPAWLLLVPDLPPEILDSKEVPTLLKTYLEESAQPLSTLVARRAARKT